MKLSIVICCCSDAISEQYAGSILRLAGAEVAVDHPILRVQAAPIQPIYVFL